MHICSSMSVEPFSITRKFKSQYLPHKRLSLSTLRIESMKKNARHSPKSESTYDPLGYLLIPLGREESMMESFRSIRQQVVDIYRTWNVKSIDDVRHQCQCKPPSTYSSALGLCYRMSAMATKLVGSSLYALGETYLASRRTRDK